MRLINADELKEIYSGNGTFTSAHFRTAIDEMPTIEPEIVRCKDCEFKQGSCCAYSAVYLRPNGFCQWGRKKDSAQEVEAKTEGEK